MIVSSRKQPLLWLVLFPMFTQCFEQHLAEHHLAVLCAGKSYAPRDYRDLEETLSASECRSCEVGRALHITIAVLLGENAFDIF